MKSTETEKSPQATPEQLEQINRYTRRPLAPEEVFVFPVILCDNDIDRDGERFPRASLEALQKLFLGKTGIFDHNPAAQNQSARIFHALVEETGGQGEGEPRCHLRAWAYMLRSEKNKELIDEIDAGIKKEVSVGCAVERVVCSVCGADHKTAPCAHQKGEVYGGMRCHHRLENPTDAYEWSFVAVPAQKNAGVTKGTGGGMVSLEKLFAAPPGEITLSPGELAGLRAQYQSLREKAGAGELYLEQLRQKAVRLLALTRPELAGALAGEIAARLEAGQLLALCKSLAPAAEGALPPRPQLAPLNTEDTPGDSPFII